MPTPDDIAGLVAWYTADPAYCFQDADALVPCGDGDLVYTWVDRKGAFDLVQATEANRPTYRDSDGYKYVAFENTRFMDHAAGIVTAVPLSLACWLYLNNITSTPVNIGKTGGTTHRFNLQTSSSSGGIAVALTVDASSASATTSTSVPLTVGGWRHIAGTFAAANSRAVYHTGGNKGTNATSKTPVGIDATRVGDNLFGSAFLDGRISEVAVWNAAISDQDVADLYAAGVPTYTAPAGGAGGAGVLAAALKSRRVRRAAQRRD